MAVLRLLAGERGYASLEPTEVREALEREAGEKNPDTGLFRQFPDALLSLNRLAAERFLRRDRAYAPPSPSPSPPLVSPEPPEAAAGDGDDGGGGAGDVGDVRAPLAGAALELHAPKGLPRRSPCRGEAHRGGGQ